MSAPSYISAAVSSFVSSLLPVQRLVFNVGVANVSVHPQERIRHEEEGIAMIVVILCREDDRQETLWFTNDSNVPGHSIEEFGQLMDHAEEIWCYWEEEQYARLRRPYRMIDGTSSLPLPLFILPTSRAHRTGTHNAIHGNKKDFPNNA